MAKASPQFMARKMLTILVNDRESYLLKLDRYLRGDHDDPYMPENADEEYKLLAKRAVTNVCPFIVATPSQSMYVDSFRRGRTVKDSDNPGSVKVRAVQPEWQHWQESGMDSKQHAVYRGAFSYGHSFVLTERDRKADKVRSKGLSALVTSALYEDPANDIDPQAALTVTAWPERDGDRTIPGKARMWDDTYEYRVTFQNARDFTKGVTVKRLRRHGADECPVTRFVCAVDLEGRTVGVIEPMIPVQDRINQTVFDMLVVQSFASFKVRTISGMAPPMKMVPIDADGNEVLNPEAEGQKDKIVDWIPLINPATGRPVPDNVNLNARRWFFAEDEDTKFDTLDETPLEGFIKAIEMGFRHMAALSQTPPHHILGEIANLSAEALEAAETALSRKVEEFKSQFGESWERVFRIAAQIGGWEGADDYSGEVIWRDLGQKSMSQSADALGKIKEQLGVPARGLWSRIPGVTATEIAHWEDLAEQENAQAALAASLERARATSRPSWRNGQTSQRTQQTEPTTPTTSEEAQAA